MISIPLEHVFIIVALPSLCYPIRNRAEMADSLVLRVCKMVLIIPKNALSTWHETK